MAGTSPEIRRFGGFRWKSSSQNVKIPHSLPRTARVRPYPQAAHTQAPGENAANAQHKPRPRRRAPRPRPLPSRTPPRRASRLPRPRRPRQNQNSTAPQNGQACRTRPQGQRRGRRPKNPEHLEMTPAIPMHICRWAASARSARTLRYMSARAIRSSLTAALCSRMPICSVSIWSSGLHLRA